MRTVLALLAVCVLCGCEISVSKAPVGKLPLNISKEQAEWNGLWVIRQPADNDDAAAAYVQVSDATNGILKVSLPETEKETLKTETYTVFLRQVGASTIVSVEVKNKESATNALVGYAWGLLEKSPRAACLWWADRKALEPLVEAGKVPAYEPGTRDLLGEFSSNHLDQITCGTNGVLFLWKEPLFFVRP